jgi:phosphoglycolate phosphatase-like HAD superfamily hydrolase
MSKPVIALDADGVLLDYNRAYARAWERAFGTHPRERDPDAYWALDRWEVERLTGERLERFRGCFDEHFWSTVPAIEGAANACEALRATGYDLVCVSALGPRFADARLRNLQDLGFPIERVIATSHASGDRSPKADALEELRPEAFVDDYLPYLIGVPQEIHTALVLRQPNGTPNIGPDLVAAKSQHSNLVAFANWWLSAR